jgi:hypothetical protein
MTKSLLIFILLPFIVCGQSLYSGFHGKYKRKWTLKINQDSSVILTCNVGNNSYNEYNGHIKKINDTLYNIQTNLTFSQIRCRAIGDSFIYVGIDTSLVKVIDTVKIEYSNKDIESFLTQKKNEITIPINKKLFNSDPNKKFFYLNVGHVNPINYNVVKTQYKIGEEYCVEIYTEKDINFNVVIKNNKLRKIGKRQIDDFTLTKNITK